MSRVPGSITPAKEALSLTGELLDVTFVFRARNYFVWQLLALTGWHLASSAGQKLDCPCAIGNRDAPRNRLVEMGGSGGIIEARGRCNVVGNTLVRWRQTTPRDEVFLRHEHSCGEKDVCRNPDFDIRFSSGHNRKIMGR